MWELHYATASSSITSAPRFITTGLNIDVVSQAPLTSSYFMAPLRVAVCDAEDAAKWHGYTLSGYKDAFGHDSDQLTFFLLPSGEHPLLEDVRKGEP